MSIHKVGCSAESLQKDMTQNLEKEFESQTKLINIRLNDISDKLETYTYEFKEQKTEIRTELRVEEIQFNNGESNIIIKAKFFLIK